MIFRRWKRALIGCLIFGFVIDIVQERSKRLEFCHSLLKVREEEFFEKKRVWKNWKFWKKRKSF